MNFRTINDEKAEGVHPMTTTVSPPCHIYQNRIQSQNLRGAHDLVNTYCSQGVTLFLGISLGFSCILHIVFPLRTLDLLNLQCFSFVDTQLRGRSLSKYQSMSTKPFIYLIESDLPFCQGSANLGLKLKTHDI